MIDGFMYLYAALVTLPIPFMLLVYFVTRKIYRHKWKAIHKTVNVMTILFILSVDLLCTVLFGTSYIGWILLFLLITFGAALIIQFNKTEDVHVLRAFKRFWRFNFLLFLTVYIGLSVYGLTMELLAL
ncbi:DUF3397 domain-containing protein [Thalassobacillus hwangdonensis]|uniref:DUF3397 domain-containing protein n=1 Tax=Thalassobacillus hwangdonensis TaxID=546108 RepID=A0ABW3KWZ5_9BACI